MPIELQTCRIEDLLEAPGGNAALVTTPSVNRFATRIPVPAYPTLDHVPEGAGKLIVIGGGSLIDRTKFWKFEERRAVEIIAVPSIWGSGAEVSPVAVRNSGMAKEILVDPRLVPDRACFWPELAETVPDSLAQSACGDAWSHALEGFLSPLADDELRAELAEVMRQMLELPVGRDGRWFLPSALACAGQARSSVGLVHGIAHTLENRLRRAQPDAGWGHARLCSVFLKPVMQFNRQNSDKWDDLAGRFELDTNAIFEVLDNLFDADAYDRALPTLDEYWMEIARDPCSRTNSSLVRPAGKAFFTETFQP